MRLLATIALICSPAWVLCHAGERADFIVAARGGGDFTTVQAAIDASSSLDPGRPVMILVRNGCYAEKLFIRRSRLTIVGEDRDSTRIVYGELRENWNRDHNGSDWGAGVVNIDTGTSDITLANLTVLNNYGSLYGAYNKHQFAVRGAGTRIMLLRCAILSDGGDALSLWNTTDGMYYHADCRFEGWVDFVCPRGWCYVTDSRFFGHNTPSASIWHDGSGDRSQKFVITRSFFDGVHTFPLGRNHLDGQFYLIGCRFSANMADRPFIRPPSSPREWRWGDRHYFWGCHREGGDYAWFRDNLHDAQGAPAAADITARWAFDGKWDPEGTMPSVLPDAFLPSPGSDAAGVSPAGLRLTWVPGRNADSHHIYFGTTREPEFRGSRDAPFYEPDDVTAGVRYFWRVDEVSDADTIRGRLWSFSTAADSGN